ncbi:hypothetical protein [Nonomuraea jabiensis]|uniref:Uncharacterized protein n=1 Tax=Nonomuraea jabiensis TaxID=882448 RepID=A0A7W9LG12_9ACTN|nr:hypothetical protein [Nonomuraea jabiensis]MBB5782338.1 hypothetical protein [Nonomuraea jabiensis]
MKQLPRLLDGRKKKVTEADIDAELVKGVLEATGVQEPAEWQPHRQPGAICDAARGPSPSGAPAASTGQPVWWSSWLTCYASAAAPSSIAMRACPVC